jgi:hypothetical protein
MGPTLLIAIYVACELIANVTASKPVSLFGVTAPGGVFIYALTFTLIDLVNERLGKAGARNVVYAAFAANLLLAVYSTLIVSLPSPSYYTHQDAYASVLGSTPRIVFASLTAYIISSLIDVEIFARWKEHFGRHKWARVLVSNTFSTGVDSILFVVIAFWGIQPVFDLIAGQYIIKMGITVLSIPLIYATHTRTAASPGS